MSDEQTVAATTPNEPEGGLPDTLKHGTIEAPGADTAMRERARDGAALTRAFQAESMATKAPVAASGLVGLVLATVLLFLNSTLLSLGETATGNDVSLRDVLLTVILAFSTLWWYGVGPRDPKPAVPCVLCAVLLLVSAAGVFDSPAGVRAIDLLIGLLIVGAVLIRAVPFGVGKP